MPNLRAVTGTSSLSINWGLLGVAHNEVPQFAHHVMQDKPSSEDLHLDQEILDTVLDALSISMMSLRSCNIEVWRVVFMYWKSCRKA